MSPANKNRIKSLKDFRKLLHQDKPFYQQLTLGDFYLYNWSVEFIFDSIKTLVEEYQKQKATSGKIDSIRYLKNAIANIQTIGLAAFVALKGFLIKYGLRKNKPYAAFLSGFLSGLLPGLIAATNIAIDIYKTRQNGSDNNEQSDKTSSVLNKPAEQSANKWFKIILFAATIFISLAPFLLQKYKSFDWLLKLLDKIYKKLQRLVVAISAKLDLKVRFNADKLVTLAEHTFSAATSIAKKFIDGMLFGNLISTGIFIIASFLEVIYFKRQSAIELLKKFLSDNYITLGVQFAILFLVTVHNELKGKRVKEKLKSAVKAKKIINAKMKSIKLAEDIDIDNAIAEALQYRLSTSVTKLTILDNIQITDIQSLHQLISRIQKRMKQITGDKIEIYILQVAEPTLNAFVIPGSVNTIYIIIGEPIIPYLQEITENEWIALLLHEYGHLIFHIKNQILESIIAYLALDKILQSFMRSLYPNEFNPIVSRAILQFSELQDLINLLRLMELEADAYVIAKGYGEHLVSLFKKLGLQYDVYDSTLDSHDVGSLRIQELEKAVKEFEKRKKEGSVIIRKLKSRAILKIS